MKLQLYVLRQLLWAFALAVGGMFFLALPGIAVSAVSKLAGVDTTVLLKYLPLLTIGLVPYILPIGFVLAVVATFGRLASDNEWTAIRMSGMHPLRLLALPALFAALLGVGTWWLVGNTLPHLKRTQKEFLLSAVKDVVKNLSPGRTELTFASFYLSGRERDGDAFLDAYVHIPLGDGERAREVRAERVSLRFESDVMLVVLQNWRGVLDDYDLRNEQTTFYIHINEMVKRDARSYDRPRYRSTRSLYDGLASGEFEGDAAVTARYEIHNRYAIGATFLMFLMLGTATGLMMRRGTQLGALAVAVGYAVAYYVLSLRFGKLLGTEGALPPQVGAWGTTVLGSIAGLLLLRKALRE